MKVSASLIIGQRLSIDGLASGDSNITGNYATATDFYIKPPSNELYHINNLSVFMEDEKIDDSSKYGGVVALIRGLKFIVEDDEGIVKNFTPNHPIRNNGELLGAGGRGGITTFAGNSVDTLTASFGPFSPSIDLEGGKGEKLIIRVEDDFSGLLAHRISVFGNIERRL